MEDITQQMINVIPADMIILIVGLYVLGMFLKNTPKIQDWLIPWILLGIGIVGSVGLTIIGKPITAANITTAILQGIACTGVTVLTNQIKKQTYEKNGQA